MADNFKPIVWSAHIETALKRKMVFTNLCNRRHEKSSGAAKLGETVKILGVGRPTVGQITDPKAALSTPENVADNSTLIKIERLDYAYYLVDDVEKVQALDGYVEALNAETAEAMANSIDTYIAGKVVNAGQAITAVTNLSKTTIARTLLSAQELLMMKDVAFDECVAVITPKAWTRLREAVGAEMTDNTSVVERGRMGRWTGMEIYVSNNIYNDGTSDCCMVMSKGAIALFEQVNDVEKFRESSYLGDIIRATHLYGADVVRAQELCKVPITSYATT